MRPVVEIEASIIDDSEGDLSKQDRAGIAFAAINITKLFEVALAIAYAAEIDLTISVKGELNNEPVMVMRTIERKETDNEE